MSARSTERITRASWGIGVLIAASLLALVPLASVHADDAAPDPDVVAAQQVRDALPLADRVAQLITTSVPGVLLDARTRAQLAAIRPGGIIVFAENYRSRAQARRLIGALAAAINAGSVPSPVVSIDQEGGVVKRIADAPPTRSHPQLGAADRIGLTTSQARATGELLSGLGIQLNLAPVADLDLGPRHVMRERSFGAQPTLVARHVAAFVDGLQAGGGAAAVKHFPGFGGASVNSDDALARIDRARAQLEVDLRPFRAASAAGVDAVMLSHAVYTRIDRRRPASASPAMYRLLREELGFDGLAITDSLHAAGFAAATRGTAVDGCVKTIAAGADMVLLTGSVAEAAACRARLLAAVRAGTLTRARVDEAVLRVLTLKSRLGLLGREAAASVSSPAPAG